MVSRLVHISTISSYHTISLFSSTPIFYGKFKYQIDSTISDHTGSDFSTSNQHFDSFHVVLTWAIRGSHVFLLGAIPMYNLVV